MASPGSNRPKHCRRRNWRSTNAFSPPRNAPGSHATTARDAPTPKIFHHNGDDGAQRKTLSAHSVVFRRSLRGKNSTFTNYTYTGQYSNVPDFGLMYYNARWYDPYLSRFAQADTIITLESQGVQAWDRYAGMNNNPVRYSDPSGHDVGCGGRYDGKNCKPTQTVKPKTPAPRPTLSLPDMQSTPVPCQGEPSNACATATAANATASAYQATASAEQCQAGASCIMALPQATPQPTPTLFGQDAVNTAVDAAGTVGEVVYDTCFNPSLGPSCGADLIDPVLASHPVTVPYSGFGKVFDAIILGKPIIGDIGISIYSWWTTPRLGPYGSGTPSPTASPTSTNMVISTPTSFPSSTPTPFFFTPTFLP